jgi:hypothetical protein
MKMLVLKIFVEIVEPIVDVCPLAALFKLFELGVNILLEIV